MEMQRQLHRLGQRRKQLGRTSRCQQSGHVLDGNRVATHLFQRHSLLYEVFDGVHRARGVADRALRMLAAADHGLDRGFEIAQVVHGVEDAEYIHAVRGRLVDEGVHHIVGVVPVAEQVLAAQQHLDGRVGQRLFECAQSFPGVLLEKADAGVEGRATPGLERPEADSIQLRTDRQHILGAQARGDE